MTVAPAGGRARAWLLAGLLLAFFGLSALAQNILPSSLPLYFEANKGQTEFLSHGNGYEFHISSTGARMALRQSGAGVAMAQMEFPGANTRAQIGGVGELSGKINYLIGSDSSKWQIGLPTFSQVRLAEIYPGIDLVFHGNQQQLEYDFNVAPGANPDVIKIRFDGVDNISLTPQGALVLKLGASEVQQSGPEIYQTINSARKIISGGYRLLDSHTVAFEMGDYDHSQPLVIDPVLSYSTYFGGTANTEGFAIVLNTNSIAGAPNGTIYIAGQTLSKQFSTSGADQTNFDGGQFNGDAFVARFSNPATNLIYLTYLGGNLDDAAFGLAVDTNGDAFIAGYTDSTNFPTTNAIYPKLTTTYSVEFGEYPGDAFVAELYPSGSNLVYSTYLGGSNAAISCADAVAIDSSDNAYVVGFTYSTNFPCTNAMQKTFQGTNTTIGLNANAFVTEIASNDASLVFSSYLGGTNLDIASSVFVDVSNNVYVAGYTASYNFPVWNVPTNLPNGRLLNGATNLNGYGNFDAFVTKFPPLTNSVSVITNEYYSTLLGSTNTDEAFGITADPSGCAYVTGFTTSTNFPNTFTLTNMSYLVTNGLSAPFGMTNVFLTKIAANGSNVDYSVVFGGSYGDIGRGVAVDSAGDAFVVGYESSTNFPVVNTFGPLSATNSGGGTYFVDNVFVTAFNQNCSSVSYSVLLGGNESVYGYQDSFGYGIAVDASDNAYITGQTAATNFPTANAPKFALAGTNTDNGLFLNGTNDAFVSEILFSNPAPQIIVGPTNQSVEVGGNVTFVLVATNMNSTLLLYQWQYTNAAETNATEIFTNLVNGGNISGVTSNILSITNVTTNDAGFYSVIVSYGSGTTNFDVTLYVTNSPLITSISPSQTNIVGSTVSFVVTAMGVPPLHYSWSTNGVTLVNGGNISGANTNILTITDAQLSDTATYQVVVANAYSPPATGTVSLVVTAAPIITTPLTNQIVGPGYVVPFAITAVGEQPLHYQWQTNGIILTNNAHYGGANTNILTVTNTQPKDTATYTIIVTNSFGAASNSATLTVLATPEFTSVAPAVGGIANGLVFNGVGGTNGGYFYIYGTSNLLLTPISSTWDYIGAEYFGSQGQFSFTITGLTNWSQEFFIIQQQ